MYTYVYIYIYIYTHTHTHSHTYTHRHNNLYIALTAFSWAGLASCVHTRTYIYTCIYIHTRTHTGTTTFILPRQLSWAGPASCIFTYIHTCMHDNIHLTSTAFMGWSNFMYIFPRSTAKTHIRLEIRHLYVNIHTYIHMN